MLNRRTTLLRPEAAEKRSNLCGIDKYTLNLDIEFNPLCFAPTRNTRIAFGPYICIGAMAVVLFGV